MAQITGTNSAEVIPGTSGSDLIYAYNGNDTVNGGDGNDYINGGRGDDILNGGIGNDVFEVGGYGSDIGLNPAGGLHNGWDTFNGGEGEDTIRILSTAGYLWTEIQIKSMSSIEVLDNANDGPGYVNFAGSINFDSIKKMNNITGIFGSAGNDTFWGGGLGEVVEGRAGNDTLYGYGGADVLDGGTGTNTLIGGAGADIYDFKDEDATTTITDFSRADGDKIRIANTIANNFSDLTITSNGASSSVTVGGLEIIVNGSQALTASDFVWADDGGDSGGDDDGAGGVSYEYIHGGNGDDYLVGTDGADFIMGYDGNDIIIAGDDTDKLFGGNGDDFIDGGRGLDEITGGLGADTFYFGGAGAAPTIKDYSAADGDKIVISSKIADEFSDLEISQTEVTTGRIRVGGFDIYVENNPTLDASNFAFYDVQHSATGQTITGSAKVDSLYGGDGDDDLYGGDGIDYLYGGAGNDFLDGGVGAAGAPDSYHQLTGGTGADVFYFSDPAGTHIIRDFSRSEGDKIRIDGAIAGDFSELTVTVGGSITTIEAGELSISLFPGIGTLVASDFEFSGAGIGDEASNQITGGEGQDKLYGRGGNDTLYGAGGNDNLKGEDGDDFLYGESGDDELRGGDGNDYLFGGGGTDQLIGDAGNDFLDPGIDIAGTHGLHRLSGGTGADVFYFSDPAGRNLILDFSRSDGDKIRIDSAIADDFSDLTFSQKGTMMNIYADDLSVILWPGIGPLVASDFEFV
ncbi:calcium-binding protein [Agrobacterium larrymoorei]|uniref:Calcium-binding protein n=1 Tax=Agrobacterium larrymoorei TaxID=160699 RepID=A0A4D7DWE6_9HYPH|nr:calcium-binding protein [Agrobacterium larrymoorei]QCI99554.1 calcium-binding protein [Agrobacterium larrymoorei]QYA09102.1 hypothetical protein J5285_17015 [Agrobacterium larrymoorei]